MPLKLNSARVAAIKADLSNGQLQNAVAQRYGISQAQVSRIATGRSWSSVPWPFGSPIGNNWAPPTEADGADPSHPLTSIQTLPSSRLAAEQAETLRSHIEEISRTGLTPVRSEAQQALEDDELLSILGDEK